MLFSLWLSFFILSGAISPLFSSSTLGTYHPGEFIFQCHTFLPFHGVLKAWMMTWFTIPFSTFYQNSAPWSICLEWPYMVWLIVSLNQTRLWSMWSVWLFIVDHPEFPAQVLTRLPSGYQWGVFLSGSQDPLPSLWGCQQNSVPCSYKAEGPSFFLVVPGVLSWAFSQHWLLETTKSILINPRVRDVRYHVKSYKKKMENINPLMYVGIIYC